MKNTFLIFLLCVLALNGVKAMDPPGSDREEYKSSPPPPPPPPLTQPVLADSSQFFTPQLDGVKKKKKRVKGSTDESLSEESDEEKPHDEKPHGIHFVTSDMFDPATVKQRTKTLVIKTLKTLPHDPTLTIRQVIVPQQALECLMVSGIPFVVAVESSFVVLFPDNTCTCISAETLERCQPLFMTSVRVMLVENIPIFNFKNDASQHDFNIFLTGETWSITMKQPDITPKSKPYPICASLDIDGLLVTTKKLLSSLLQIQPADQNSAESPVPVPVRHLLKQHHVSPVVRLGGKKSLIIPLDVSGSMFCLNGRNNITNLTRFLFQIQSWCTNMASTRSFDRKFPVLGRDSSGDVPMMVAITYVITLMMDFINGTLDATRIVIIPFSKTVPSRNFVIVTTQEEALEFIQTLPDWINKWVLDSHCTIIRIPNEIRLISFEPGSELRIISDGSIDGDYGKPETTSIEHITSLVANGGVKLRLSCVIVCDDTTAMTTESPQFKILSQLCDNMPDVTMTLFTVKYGNPTFTSSGIVANETDETDIKTKKATTFRNIEEIEVKGIQIKLVNPLESMVLLANLTGTSLGSVFNTVCKYLVTEKKDESMMKHLIPLILKDAHETYGKWLEQEKNLILVPLRFYIGTAEEQHEIIKALIISQKSHNKVVCQDFQPKITKVKGQREIPPQAYVCFADLLRQRKNTQAFNMEIADSLTIVSIPLSFCATIARPRFDVQMMIQTIKMSSIQDGSSLSFHVNVATRQTKWRISIASDTFTPGQSYPESTYDAMIKRFKSDLSINGANMIEVLKQNPNCQIAISNHVTADRSMKDAKVVPSELPNDRITVRFAKTTSDTLALSVERNGSVVATTILQITPTAHLCISAVMPEGILTVTGDSVHQIDTTSPLFMCDLPLWAVEKPKPSVSKKYSIPDEKERKCPPLTIPPVKAAEIVQLFRIVVGDDDFKIISVNPRVPVAGMKGLKVSDFLQYATTSPVICNTMLLILLKRYIFFSDPLMFSLLENPEIATGVARFLSVRCDLQIQDATSYVKTLCGITLLNDFDIKFVHDKVMSLFPSPSETIVDLSEFKQCVSDGGVISQLNSIDNTLKAIGNMSIWTSLFKKLSLKPDDVSHDITTLLLSVVSVRGLDKFKLCASLLAQIASRMVAFGKRFSFENTISSNDFRKFLCDLDVFLKTNCTNGKIVLDTILTLNKTMSTNMQKQRLKEQHFLGTITELMTTTPITLVCNTSVDPTKIHAVVINWGKVTDLGELGPYECSDLVEGFTADLNSTPSGNTLDSPVGLLGSSSSHAMYGIMSNKEVRHALQNHHVSPHRVAWVDTGLDGQKIDMQPPGRTYFDIGEIDNLEIYMNVTTTMQTIIKIMDHDDKACARWRSVVLMKVLWLLGVFNDDSPPLDFVSIVWHVMLNLPITVSEHFNYSMLEDSSKLYCVVCSNESQPTDDSSDYITFPVTPCGVICSGCMDNWTHTQHGMTFNECVNARVTVRNPITNHPSPAQDVYHHCQRRNTPGTLEYQTFQEYLGLLQLSQQMITPPVKDSP